MRSLGRIEDAARIEAHRARHDARLEMVSTHVAGEMAKPTMMSARPAMLPDEISCCDDPASSIGLVRGCCSDLPEWLRKKGKQEPRATELSSKLDACAPASPCGSGACPACGEAFQRDFAAAAGRFIEEQWCQCDSVVCAGIALPSLAAPRGGLQGLNLLAAKRRVQERLSRAGVGLAFGAWDYSMNQHQTARYAPFWLPHLHLLIGTGDPGSLRQGLKRSFPSSDAVPRPVRVQVWDGHENALLYLLKRKFDRRIGIDNAERFSPKTGKWRLCRATSQQHLRSAERLELLLHLDEIGLDGRVFMRKAQLRLARGSIRIVPMP